jgi:hypothetical protein
MTGIALSTVLAVGLAGLGSSAVAGPITFSYDHTIDTYTIPTTGIYEISAYGASGGNSNSYLGGLGAELTGDFNLNAGDVLHILVGNQGLSTYDGGTGGGGTFVYDVTDATLLEAAGGGGGASQGTGPGGAGQSGTSGTNGQTSLYPVSIGFGGSNGNGGTAGNYNGDSGGGGGGGYLTNGTSSYADSGGLSFLNGGGDPGIFGGGGTENTGGAGGGGGYSGGGGGGYYGAGGGGGSYDGGLSDANFLIVSGLRSGNGQAQISAMSGITPEPASLILAGLGLLGLVLMRGSSFGLRPRKVRVR